MGLASKHVFNHFFDEIQNKIKQGDPAEVFRQFETLSEMALNHTIAPIHYYYLLNGVDPNRWLSEKDGYKRYEKTSDAPIFWLNKFLEPKTRLTYGQLSDFRMQEVEHKIRKEIDARYEKEDRERREKEAQTLKEMRQFSTEGTPFDKNWQIRPPSKEH